MPEAPSLVHSIPAAFVPEIEAPFAEAANEAERILQTICGTVR